MRKAITPIIGIVMLILITVIASVAAFIWINSIQLRLQERAGSSAEGQSMSGCSRINLISMRGNSLVVQNNGCDTINNVTLLIDGVLTEYDLSAPLAPGGTSVIFYSSLYAGEEHVVKVVLATGYSSSLVSPAVENTPESGYVVIYTCLENVSSCLSPNVWFAGTINTSNYNNCACCGDDGVNDDFFNGSIEVTNAFCHLGYATFQTLDTNQTLCEYYGYDWLNTTGYYPGSYSFENDALDSVPSGWTVYKPDIYGYVLVKNYTTHSKVIEIRDADSSHYYSATKTFSSNASTGSVEFYFEFNAPYAGGGTYIKIIGVNDYILLRIMGGGLLRETNSTSDLIRSVSEGTWYHAKIDFDVNTGWNIQINGVNYGGAYTYRFYDGKNPVGINGISFMSGLAVNPLATHEYQRFDAIGYSWDSNYTIGENLYASKCCGDDGVNDNFSNATNSCINGIFS